MVTLLERIQAALTFDPKTDGYLCFSTGQMGRSTSVLSPSDVAEIVGALVVARDKPTIAVNFTPVAESFRKLEATCAKAALDVARRDRDDALSARSAEVAGRIADQRGFADAIAKLTEERNHLCDENHAFRTDLAAAREQVARLTNTNTELSAAVAQMTSGVPAAWMSDTQFCIGCVTPSKQIADGWIETGAKVFPLFRATQPSPQVAELAAKVETLGIELAREKRMREETRLDLVKAQDERDSSRADHLASSRIHLEQRAALQARVETLTAGERLTKDALAAAEKNCDSWKERALLAEDAATKAIKDRAAAESDVRHLKDEIRRMEREASVGLSRLTDARRCAEAAESRLRDLETSAEPHSWGIEDREGGTRHFTYMSDALAAAKRGEHGDPFPLYRHPPKTGEPVAWRYSSAKFPGTTPFFLTESRRQPGLVETPLYEAPPPAAIGVADERCVVLEVDRLRTVNVKGPDHLIGTRAQAEERAKALHGTAYRLVPIDAPVVDVAAIRKALSPDRNWVPTIVRAEILAAIGDR